MFQLKVKKKTKKVMFSWFHTHCNNTNKGTLIQRVDKINNYIMMPFNKRIVVCIFYYGCHISPYISLNCDLAELRPA